MESNPPAFSRASFVKRGKNLSCLRPFKVSKKGQVQSNRSCAQLQSDPRSWYYMKNYTGKCFVNLKNGQEKVKVKTTGLVHTTSSF